MKKISGVILTIVAAALMSAWLVGCGGTGKVTVEFVTGTDEDIAAVTVDDRGAFGTLPIPTRRYYEFVGWSFDEGGENIVTERDTVIGTDDKRCVLYAQWEFGGVKADEPTIASQCVIDDDGMLWAWGDNDTGSVGDGTYNATYTPVKVATNKRFRSVVNGGATYHAIDEDGVIWSWGSNAEGALGCGITKLKINSPQVINAKMKFTHVASYAFHSYAIDENGDAWLWGGFSEVSAPNVTTFYISPVRISQDASFTDIATGDSFAVALDENGDIWTLGLNYYAQLGKGNNDVDVSAPTLLLLHKFKKIDTPARFVQVSAGTAHALAVDEDGGLWGWGNNGSGQAGDNTFDMIMSPTKIDMPYPVVKAYANGASSYVIDVNGTLWAFGANRCKMYAEENYLYTPTRLLPEMKFAELNPGSVLMAKTEDGKLYAWGDNTGGFIGDGYFEQKYTGLYQITSGIAFETVVSSGHYCLAIDVDGTLYSWGRYSSGCLGDGTEDDRLTPKAICEGVEFSGVAVGSGSSYAIDVDGNLWAWGDNGYGQLGLGDKEKRLAPEKVPFDCKIVQIVAGSAYACAVGDNGKLYFFGMSAYSSHNKILTESNINKYVSPQPAACDISFKRLAIFTGKILGIDTDGNLQYNEMTNKFVKLCEGIAFEQVYIKNHDCFAIDVNGNLYGWGRNTSGLLDGYGDKTAMPVNEPKIINEGTKYTVITFYDGVYAVTADNKLECWGSSIGTVNADTRYKYVTAVTSVNCMAIDIDGNIWICGIYKYYLCNGERLDLYPITEIYLR